MGITLSERIDTYQKEESNTPKKSEDKENDFLGTAITFPVDLLEKKGAITREKREQEIKRD